MSKVIDTLPFEASHMCKPSGHGNWFFQNGDGSEINRVGDYREIARALPAGTWKVLP